MIAARDRRDRPASLGERRAVRATRDQAIRALSGAGLSSREISALRLCDVQCFPSGKVSLRIFRRGVPLVRLLDGRGANQVARHLESLADADRVKHPVFAGRVAGFPLTHRAVLLVLRDPNDPIERRER